MKRFLLLTACCLLSGFALANANPLVQVKHSVHHHHHHEKHHEQHRHRHSI